MEALQMEITFWEVYMSIYRKSYKDDHMILPRNPTPGDQKQKFQCI